MQKVKQPITPDNDTTESPSNLTDEDDDYSLEESYDESVAI